MDFEESRDGAAHARNDWSVPRTLAGAAALVITAHFGLIVARAGLAGVLFFPPFHLAEMVLLLFLTAFALGGHRPGVRDRLAAAFGVAALGGAGAFAYGAVWAIAVGANLGPLVPLFFTGPLGFAAGGAVGLLLALTPVHRPIVATLRRLR